MSEQQGHGEVGKVETPFIPFTQILVSRPDSYDTAKLGVLAKAMAMHKDSLSDGADAEENLFMPAGYTYFGQFIDHDLTLDTTSTLNPDDLKDPSKPLNDPTNLRSPRFDLDCVYGNGPGDQPYMYAVSDDAANGVYLGATLLIGAQDLARASNHRAIIGDKRNDENSIVNQIQQLFIRFHNKVVNDLATADATLRGGDLFKKARDEVRWAYQRIIVDDYLPRIIDASVLDNFRETLKYQLYPKTDIRQNVPREFVAAAYRFGHSAVRTGYRLNGQPGASNGLILPIFTNPPAANADDSLVGFDPLPIAHVIDSWGRFFPVDTPAPGERLLSNFGPSEDVAADGTGGDGTVRLQYAYKLDPSITDPLADLPPKIASNSDVPSTLSAAPKGPSLALLNLLRGNRYRLQGGQAYAAKLGVPPLDPKYLAVRQSSVAPDGSKLFSITPISELTDANGIPIGNYFDNDTPLWFYVLAEAQKPVVDYWLDHGKATLTENQLKGLDASGNPVGAMSGGNAASTASAAKQQLLDTRCAGTQLGQVGGRIVAEVFYGLLESDMDSILSAARKPKGWQPVWGGGVATMTKLINYLDPARAPK